MGKESIRASIEQQKGHIARIRAEIATIRSRKSEASARYSANIKNASSASDKANLRRQKASVIAQYESQIRNATAKLSAAQSSLASLRETLKRAK